MPPENMTLEQAQERILELESELEARTAERDTLLQNNNELTTNLENARRLNQKLFERVEAQKSEEARPQEDDEAPTCEEFAKTIII